MRKYDKIAGCAGLASKNMLIASGDVYGPGCR
jgi:hypothetical protein